MSKSFTKKKNVNNEGAAAAQDGSASHEGAAAETALTQTNLETSKSNKEHEGLCIHRDCNASNLSRLTDNEAGEEVSDNMAADGSNAELYTERIVHESRCYVGDKIKCIIDTNDFKAYQTYIKEHTRTVHMTVHPSMFSLILYFSKSDAGNVQVNIPSVNHNNPTRKMC